MGGTIKDITTDYIYDKADRLSKLTISEGTTTKNIENFYNGDGQRIKQNEDGLITKYYYDDGNLLFTTDNNNSKETENILDPSGVIVASKRFDGIYNNMYFFYNYDIRGSVTNIINPDGQIVKGYDYDEFGGTKEKGDYAFKNDVKFTGAVHDKSANLYYMNARFYNPNTGRFITEDTYSGNAYEPWTQHLYSYTSNNPVNFIDPTGHRAMYAMNLEDETDVQRSTSLKRMRRSSQGKYKKSSNPYIKSETVISQSPGNIKPIPKSSEENLLKKASKIIEIEAGAGAGLGFNAKALNLLDVGAGAEAYYIDIKYEKGEFQGGSKVNAGVALKSKAVKNFAVGAEYSVYRNLDDCQFANPLEQILIDPKSQKSSFLGVKYNKKHVENNIYGVGSEGNIPVNSRVTVFGLGIAVGVAVHIEVGINVDALREFNDYMMTR